VGVPRKVDAVVAGLNPGTQREIRRLLNLFEGAVAGLLFEGQLRTFTSCSPWEQDDRLRGWAHSRVTLRRSGFRALKKLVTAAYYSSPEAWPAIGYPGPPLAPPPVPAERPPVPEGNEEETAAPKPPAPAPPGPPARAEEPPRQAGPAPRPAHAPRPPEAVPAPRPVESVPAPRSGIPTPEETENP
jgi:hypothetical protein